MARKKILTPEFRASFVHVFKPQAPMEEGGQPKYGISMLFSEDSDLTELKAEADALLKELYPTGKVPKGFRMPFRDQGDHEYEGYVPGCEYISATSKDRPGVVDNKLQAIIDPNEFYSGAYALATVRAFSYDKGVNKGIAFGLQNVQKLRDGESLSGRGPAEKDFDAVAEGMFE